MFACCPGGCADGGPSTWNFTQNVQVNGGSLSTTDLTVGACLTRCSQNVSCQGFDWDTTTTPSCWIIANANPWQTAPGVLYYQKKCGVSGFRKQTIMIITSQITVKITRICKLCSLFMSVQANCVAKYAVLENRLCTFLRYCREEQRSIYLFIQHDCH